MSETGVPSRTSIGSASTILEIGRPFQIIEHESEPLLAGCRGVARYTCIVHAGLYAGFFQRALKLRREPFGRTEAIARIEAVPKGDDQFVILCSLCLGRRILRCFFLGCGYG